MTELIRYSLVGKEDLALGTGTFEVRLADGRVVVLSKIDIGALLNDATISTQDLTLGTLTLTGLTVSGTLTLASITFSGAFDLTSGQIKFPATQVPSSNANTLDDYEEGEWTPSVGGTATYGSQVGNYVKIGRNVFITGKVTITTIGTGSTTVISGLPFTAHGRDQAVAVGETQSLALSVVGVEAYVVASTTTIALSIRTAAAASSSAIAVLGDSSSIMIGGWYVADA